MTINAVIWRQICRMQNNVEKLEFALSKDGVDENASIIRQHYLTLLNTTKTLIEQHKLMENGCTLISKISALQKCTHKIITSNFSNNTKDAARVLYHSCANMKKRFKARLS